MTTTHKMLATIPCGPKDEGAEIECLITFTYTPGYETNEKEPPVLDDIAFVSAKPYCNGRPAPFLDYPDLQQATLNDLVADWLETEDGVSQAMDAVEPDTECELEYIEELKREGEL